MTKRIRIIAVLTIVCLLLGLVACKPQESGPTDPNKPTPTATKAATPTPTEAPEENFNPTGYPIVKEPITITHALFKADYYGEGPDMQLWQKLEELTNIKFEWHYYADDMQGRELYFADTSGYKDLTNGWLVAPHINKYAVEADLFMDLAPLIDEYMPNLKKHAETYPEAMKVVRQLNGKMYTLPTLYKAATSAQGQLFFRTDYLEQVGLEMPKTVDEMYTALLKIRDAGLTKGKSPLLTTYQVHIGLQLEPYFFNAFGEATDPRWGADKDGKVVCNAISEQYKRYLTFMNKLYEEKLLDNEIFTMETATASGRIKDGEAAFMTGAAMLNEEDFPDGKIHLDCMAPLVSEYTDKQKIQGCSVCSTWGPLIRKDCEYGRELARFLDIFYSHEEIVPGSGVGGPLICHGVENVHWRYTSPQKDGYEIIVPDTWKDSVWDYKLKHVNFDSFFGSILFLGYSSSPNNQARERGMVKNNMPYAVDPFPRDFLKFTPEDNELLSGPLGNIDKLIDTARAEFISGGRDIEKDWDKYVADVKTLGLEQVLKLYQAAYDAWKK